MSTDTRIESLETQVRTLKRMLFGVFGLVVVGGLLAAASMQSVPDVIQAKSFEVVNDEGKPVAGIYATTGGGLLSVSNKDGKQVAGIYATANGMGMLSVSNKDGKQVAAINSTVDGGLLSVYNKEGKLSTLLAATENGGLLGILNIAEQYAGVFTVHEALGGYVSTWGAGEVVTGIMPGNENTDGAHQAAGHGDDYEREAQARRANQRIPIPSNEELREIYNRAQGPQSKP